MTEPHTFYVDMKVTHKIKTKIQAQSEEEAIDKAKELYESDPKSMPEGTKIFLDEYTDEEAY